MSDHSNVVAADLPEPYSAEVGLQRHIEQAHAISSLLSEAGVGPCSLPEGVRLLMNDRDRLADALAAAREELAEARDNNASLADMVRAQEDELLRRKAILESVQHQVDHAGEHLAAARAEAEDLRVLLQARDAETDAQRAEVELAFRAGYIAGADEEDHDFPEYDCGSFNAAWSRYQQENKR